MKFGCFSTIDCQLLDNRQCCTRFYYKIQGKDLFKKYIFCFVWWLILFNKENKIKKKKEFVIWMVIAQITKWWITSKQKKKKKRLFLTQCTVVNEKFTNFELIFFILNLIKTREKLFCAFVFVSWIFHEQFLSLKIIYFFN